MYVTDVRLPQASPFGDPAVSRAGSRGAIVRKKTTKRASIFPSGPLAGLGWVAGLRGSILLLDLSVLEI